MKIRSRFLVIELKIKKKRSLCYCVLCYKRKRRKGLEEKEKEGLPYRFREFGFVRIGIAVPYNYI